MEVEIRDGEGGPVGRVLLVINEASGVGHGGEVVGRLRSVLAASPVADGAEVAVVRDHASVSGRVARFVAAGGEPALVIVGGGSGSLRAAIEGLCRGSGGLPGPGAVRLAALRMGSGNPLARRFGAARDPERTLEAVLAGAEAGHLAPCCVMRCDLGEAGGAVRHAATMVGLGQFGRVPGDIERWREGAPRLRAALGRLLGIERVNTVEYVLATLLRGARCAASGEGAVERMEVRAGGRRWVMRLLAGVVMNGPVDELPLDPGVRVEDEEVSVCLVPYAGRLSALRLVLDTRRLLRSAVRVRLARGEALEVRPLDRGGAPIFLDEDPDRFSGRLTVAVAGSVAFVPGPEYAIRERTEVPA